MVKPDPQFETFLADFQVRTGTVDACRMCLLDERYTNLDDTNSVTFGKGERICLDCGRRELRREVSHIGHLGRDGISHLEELLLKFRNLDRVLYFAQYIVTYVDEDARQKALKRLEDEINVSEREQANQINTKILEVKTGRDRKLAVYQTGYASFALGEYPAAGNMGTMSNAVPGTPREQHGNRRNNIISGSSSGCTARSAPRGSFSQYHCQAAPGVP